MLKIRELTDEKGALSALFLRWADGALELVRDLDGAAPPGGSALPEKALEAVMSRYGAPFDPEARISIVGTLALGAGRALHHVRHLAGYDVIARDYLVYEVQGAESLCALATVVARGLEHLADVARARSVG